MFLSVHAFDSPCMLHPAIGSKNGVYIYLNFAVITVHFTDKVVKSMWDSDIPNNFQFGLQCHSLVSCLLQIVTDLLKASHFAPSQICE